MKLLVVCTAAAVLAFAAPATASHVPCGAVLTQDTKLDSDVDCPGEGISIGAEGVRLDLRGYTVSGGVSTVYPGADGVAVRNGTILGGIAIHGDGNTIDRLTVRKFEGPAVSASGANLRITHSDIESTFNEHPALEVLHFTDAVIRHNSVSSRVGTAILLGLGHGALVAHNLVHDSARGIVVESASGVREAHNTFERVG